MVKIGLRGKVRKILQSHFVADVQFHSFGTFYHTTRFGLRNLPASRGQGFNFSIIMMQTIWADNMQPAG